MLRSLILSLLVILNLAPALAQPGPRLQLVTELSPHSATARVLAAADGARYILVADETAGTMALFHFAGGELKRTAETKSRGHVWGATLIGNGDTLRIVVAYGMGRGNLNPPLEIYAYPAALDKSEKVWTFNTPRAQATVLKAIGSRVLVTFFSSKYDTEAGWLSLTKDHLWKYTKEVSVRMGSNSDSNGELIALGRPYGDEQGSDGDVILYRKGQAPRTLPSYRGVSALTLLPVAKNEQPSIAIGDGWHANYGKFAQARLSILRPVPQSDRYALDLVQTIENSWAVNRIIPVSKPSDARLFLVTNNRLMEAVPGKDWQVTSLYQQTDQNSVFDCDLLPAADGSEYAVISDGKVSLYKVRPSDK